jgi:protein gp37
MAARTNIEWTERTWNPVRGCSRVSPGCERCYAERVAHRFAGAGQPYEDLTRASRTGPRWTGRLRLVDDALDAPLGWRQPKLVFVNSMSDLWRS